MTKAVAWSIFVAGCLPLCFAGCDRSRPTAISGPGKAQLPVEADQAEPSAALDEVTRDPTADEVELGEPTSYKPLVAAAAIFPMNFQTPGNATLLIRVKTAPGWHIYAADKPAGTSQPTRLDLQLPEGVEAEGDWIYPEATKSGVGSDGKFVYEGDFAFRRRLKVSEGTPRGRFNVGCEIHYQACDPFSCRPPETATVEATADVVPAL